MSQNIKNDTHTYDTRIYDTRIFLIRNRERISITRAGVYCILADGNYLQSVNIPFSTGIVYIGSVSEMFVNRRLNIVGIIPMALTGH